jgi:hypothetical protein
MAFHEHHERKCPACGERMSATAPRCLNCGRFVDEPEEEEEEQPERSRAGWVWGVVLVGAVIVLGLIAYSQRGRPAPPPLSPEIEAVLKVAEMTAKVAGRGAWNQNSPMTLAEVEPHLRVGMSFAEVSGLVSGKNDGPNRSTVMTSVPLPREAEQDEEEDKPRPQAYIIFLSDANLIVVTDAQEKVTSWQARPLP